MFQKNESTVLVLALLITTGLVGAGVWWFTSGSGLNLGRGLQNPSTPPQQPTPPESFAKVQNVPSGLFNYGGSTTWAPIRKDVDPAIQTLWPQFQLRYTQPTAEAPGSGTGIKMLVTTPTLPYG